MSSLVGQIAFCISDKPVRSLCYKMVIGYFHIDDVIAISSAANISIYLQMDLICLGRPACSIPLWRVLECGSTFA